MILSCRYLNVYTPRRNASRPPPKEGFPVWFYVHGGAYEAGNAIADGTGALIHPHWIFEAGFEPPPPYIKLSRTDPTRICAGMTTLLSSPHSITSGQNLRPSPFGLQPTREN